MTATEMLTQGFRFAMGECPFSSYAFSEYRILAIPFVTARIREVTWCPGMNRDGTTWESLIRGGEASPLFEALNKTYKADKRVAKYKEVTEYIEKIFARPQQRSTGSG